MNDFIKSVISKSIGKHADVINRHAIGRVAGEEIINSENGIIKSSKLGQTAFNFDAIFKANKSEMGNLINAASDVVHTLHALKKSRSLSKGTEAERWLTTPYLDPIDGANIELLRSLNYSVNDPNSDTDHVVAVAPNSVTITRMGNAVNVSDEAAQISVVDIETKHNVYARLYISRVQSKSVSFDLLMNCMRQTQKSLLQNIQRDVMRIMALGLAAGGRNEFASGDAWTLAMFQTAIQELKENGANMDDLYLALDAEYWMKLWALEDTAGHNIFLNNLYVPKLDDNGDTPLRVGPAKIVGVANAPGVEDNWSAIETTETHKAMFMYDKNAIPVSIESSPYVFEDVTLSSATFNWGIQQLYGADVLDSALIQAFKEYEA